MVNDLKVRSSETKILLSVTNTRTIFLREHVIAREVLLGSNARSKDSLTVLRNLNKLRIANSITIVSMLTTVLATLSKVLRLDHNTLVLVELHLTIAELRTEALLLTEALPHVELNGLTTSAFF
jgi:hypothetical protein